VNDLLDGSQLEAGQLRLFREAVDLPALVREAVERTRGETEGIPIQVRVRGTLPPISVDRGRIEQVLENLLSNAAKYSAPNTKILVTLSAAESAVDIAVSNRGPGIPPEELPHLFTRFYRTQQAQVSGIPGHGIGLYVSHRLVEAHGGRLWAESTPGRRTTFHVSLPLSQ
jgi:signal transduction histidine kinase